MFSGKIDAARRSLQFVTPGISELAVAEIQVRRTKFCVQRLRLVDSLCPYLYRDVQCICVPFFFFLRGFFMCVEVFRAVVRSRMFFLVRVRHAT